MTKRYWTPEKKADYRTLMEAREHRRKYIREYMRKARAKGTVKHWREYEAKK